MKYIIDVEKIEGTNLWKAKEFNALVFDEHGLMRMMTLEDELGDYYGDLREEIYSQKREIELLVKNHEKLRDEKTELKIENEKLIDRLKKENEELKKYNNHLEKEWKDFDNICSRLKIENEDLKVELKEYKAVCNVAFEDIEGLKNENKALAEQNSALEDEVVDFEVICTKLHNEKAELLEKINSLDNKLLEKSVPIEEVVDKKYYNKKIGSLNDTYYDDALFIDEHTLRLIEKLNHTIKSQKGIIKKQGKDISRLQKENKKLKIYEKMVKRLD